MELIVSKSEVLLGATGIVVSAIGLWFMFDLGEHIGKLWAKAKAKYRAKKNHGANP